AIQTGSSRHDGGFYEELRQQGSAIKLTTICPITVALG
ncbi:hypothetical protein JTE90_023922, partial [Oedothorax gibbosus]